jgi:enamine deaminase RidA (YjgF/YER057c/UK114 family)
VIYLSRVSINPPNLPTPKGYAHIVEAKDMKAICFISGQVPVRRGKVICKDFATQTELAFDNLKKALEHIGLSFNDVVKLNIYITDMRFMQELKKVRAKFLPKDALPAITTVGVIALARRGAMIEVEAVAIK